MNKPAYAFVVIEKSIMVFKHAKDKGLIIKRGLFKKF